jgi:hypothetical protein
MAMFFSHRLAVGIKFNFSKRRNNVWGIMVVITLVRRDRLLGTCSVVNTTNVYFETSYGNRGIREAGDNVGWERDPIHGLPVDFGVVHFEKRGVDFEVFANEGVGFTFVSGWGVGNDVFDGVHGGSLGGYEG